jgi:hypothetical protein
VEICTARSSCWRCRAAHTWPPRPRLQLIEVLAFFKYGATRLLISHTNMFVAWLFNTLFSLALVAGSSFLVVGFAPSAQGSGVPEVMAYLNGCLIPKVGGYGRRRCAWCSSA